MATITSTIEVTPVTPAVGGVVEGVDLSRPLDARTVARLREAWLDRGVLFFRGQDISEAQLETFIGYFGKPITEPSNASFGSLKACTPSCAIPGCSSVMRKSASCVRTNLAVASDEGL